MPDQNFESSEEERIAPYLYLRDPGVHTFEEFEQFKKKFPDCSAELIVWTYARLVYEKRGVRILGY